MLLGTSGASLLGNLLTGKGILRVGSGNKKGKGTLRAGCGSKKGKGIVRAVLEKNGTFNGASSFNKFRNTDMLQI